MQDNNYIRRTLYIKPCDKDINEFLKTKGRNSSQYICDLIRNDMENKIPDLIELKKQLDELSSMTMLNYKGSGVIEEVSVFDNKQPTKIVWDDEFAD